MAATAERFQRIDHEGFIPTPSGAGALFLQDEEGRDSFLVLGVFRASDKTYRTALVTFELCMQSIFGYPNDEAYSHDPRALLGDGGFGFAEVLDSTWPERLIDYNERAFPNRTPSHYSAMRHFFVGSRDASGEFLAQDMKIELTSAPYGEVARNALQRLVGST